MILEDRKIQGLQWYLWTAGSVKYHEIALITDALRDIFQLSFYKMKLILYW